MCNLSPLQAAHQDNRGAPAHAPPCSLSRASPPMQLRCWKALHAHGTSPSAVHYGLMHEVPLVHLPDAGDALRVQAPGASTAPRSSEAAASAAASAPRAQRASSSTAAASLRLDLSELYTGIEMGLGCTGVWPARRAPSARPAAPPQPACGASGPSSEPHIGENIGSGFTRVWPARRPAAPPQPAWSYQSRTVWGVCRVYKGMTGATAPSARLGAPRQPACGAPVPNRPATPEQGGPSDVRRRGMRQHCGTPPARMLHLLSNTLACARLLLARAYHVSQLECNMPNACVGAPAMGTGAPQRGCTLALCHAGHPCMHPLRTVRRRRRRAAATGARLRAGQAGRPAAQQRPPRARARTRPARSPGHRRVAACAAPVTAIG